jgi:hypothetical protein
MNEKLHRFVRYAEILIVGTLAIFAFATYRELSLLRQVPVALPSYVFEVFGGPDVVVQTRGTWIALDGAPEPLLTTTIECRKARLECVESAAAVVFVSGKGLLESTQTIFEVERWNEREVVSKPAAGPCSTRTLHLDLTHKRAWSRVGASEQRGRCNQLPARSLDLVAGYKLHAVAVDKARSF